MNVIIDDKEYELKSITASERGEIEAIREGVIHTFDVDRLKLVAKVYKTIDTV